MVTFDKFLKSQAIRSSHSLINNRGIDGSTGGRSEKRCDEFTQNFFFDICVPQKNAEFLPDVIRPQDTVAAYAPMWTTI